MGADALHTVARIAATGSALRRACHDKRSEIRDRINAATLPTAGFASAHPGLQSFFMNTTAYDDRLYSRHFSTL